jgi:6-phosphogluconolactonase (cycloisomerase 2 family)
MAVDAAGHLYVALAGAGSIAQFTINGTTGALSGGATISSGAGTQQVAINPAGTFLFASNFNAGTVTGYTIAPGAGTLTANGSVTIGGSPQGLVVHNGGGALFVVDNAGARVVAYSIAASGALTLSSSVATGALPVGVTVEPGGNFLYVSNSGAGSITQYTISGGIGLSGRNDFSSNGSTPLYLLSRGVPPGTPTPPTVTAVPAVSTWMLVLLGMLLAGSSAVLYKRAYR